MSGSITGTWYNELGSEMTIATAENGQLIGTYTSAVGDAESSYPLTGRYNTNPSLAGQACAWSVAWTNEHGTANSATSWSGQYQTTPSGEEIYTLWLLASEVTPENDWASTQVGQGTFTRTKPTPDAIQNARQRRNLPCSPASAGSQNT